MRSTQHLPIKYFALGLHPVLACLMLRKEVLPACLLRRQHPNWSQGAKISNHFCFSFCCCKGMSGGQDLRGISPDIRDVPEVNLAPSEDSWHYQRPSDELAGEA